ncbi:MAG TPA: YdcF family protein [Polyangia bacterium]|nr:YdcF family protein [Polyangia bacterium]
MPADPDPIAPVDPVALVERAGDADRDALTAALLAAAPDLVARWFAEIIFRGLYDQMVALLRRDRPGETPVLRALGAARPDYGAPALNADALELFRAGGARAEYDLLIVPGYTPLDARAPVKVDDNPTARARLDLAAENLRGFVAPFVFVSGGSVHPPGTPLNEGLMMREYLIARGIPAARILVDPFARHSTTNLRNAGRALLAANLKRGLIVTGFDNDFFDQSFYFANPVVSTFQQRCRSELGYTVGALGAVDDHRVAFEPAPEVTTLDYRDPLDY